MVRYDGTGLILTATHRALPVAVAKVRHFTPPDDSLPNIAPSGIALAVAVVMLRRVA